MSVLVKGMEMPENCFECALQTDYGTCGFYSLYVEAGHEVEINKRREDCPLIDADELWIPVTERLPDENDVVLITDNLDVGTGYLVHGYGWISPFDDIETSHVSHWMPLPEPPKEET